MARLDEAHARSPVGIVTAPFLTRETRDSPLQVGDGILDYERFEGGAEVLWVPGPSAVAEAGLTGRRIG